MAYASQATVTVPAPTGSHTNFTLLITGTRAQMATVANGGQVQNTVAAFVGGPTVPADLILSSDTAGTSLYSWGWDYYNAVTGQVIIWVKIPSYTAGLTIYVSVGNAAVVAYQGGARGSEYDANTKPVYHLPDGVTTSFLDFSANAYDGTNAGTSPAAGKIDGGASSSGTTQRFTIPNAAVPATNLTISAWVNVTQSGNLKCIFRADGASNSLYLYINGSHKLFFGAGNTLTGTTTVTTGTHHVVATMAGATLTVYLDGVADGTNGLAQVIGAISAAYALGDPFNQFLNGTGDEVRLDSVTRSANWIATLYANQNTPPAISTFVSLTSFAPVSLPMMGCQ